MSEVIRYSWSHEAILKCSSKPGRSFACGPTGDAAQQIRIDRGDRVISRDSTGQFEQDIDRDTCVRFRSVRAARKSNTEMIGDQEAVIETRVMGDDDVVSEKVHEICNDVGRMWGRGDHCVGDTGQAGDEGWNAHTCVHQRDVALDNPSVADTQGGDLGDPVAGARREAGGFEVEHDDGC